MIARLRRPQGTFRFLAGHLPCLCTLLVLLSVVSPPAQSQNAAPASPSGLFAKIDIEDASSFCKPKEDVHTCLQNLYRNLLMLPHVAGLTIGQRWDHIQLSSEGCQTSTSPILCHLDHTDLSYLADAFSIANSFGKSVQLVLTPGVDTPRFVLARLPSCNQVLASGAGAASSPGCGKVTLHAFQQQQRADGNVLPLPWNDLYRAYWNDFLRIVAAEFNTSDNRAFVGIDVARPVAASDEMILPTSAYKATMGPAPGVPADDAWQALIQNSFPTEKPAYWDSDDAFVEAWTQTIQDYDAIFSGVTLVLGPDAGNYFPELPTASQDKALFDLDCAHSNFPDSCRAKTNIVSSFFYGQGRRNARATHVGGMTASNPTSAADSKLGMGIGGVKLLTVPQPSMRHPLPPPLLGGAALDHPVSTGKNIQDVGCPPATPAPCGVTTEEAAFNVLTVLFDNTPAAAYFGFGGVGTGKCGNTLVQYLDVPYMDISNAETRPAPKKASSIPGLGFTTLQELLITANQDLLALANGDPLPGCR